MQTKPIWILIAIVAFAACSKSEQSTKPEPTAPAAQSAKEEHHNHAHDDHAHGDPDQAAASIKLDNGKKWQTDSSLQTGMAAIRDRLQPDVEPIHAKTYSVSDYEKLAADIDKLVGNIVANCKLPRDADDQLHLVLAQFVAGTAIMKKDGNRMAGASKIVRGLNLYGKYFDDPGWKPLIH